MRPGGSRGLLPALELFFGLSTLLFWSMALISAALISTGNMSRWSNVVHPILHGAYDKVPNIPERYTRKHFAKGSRRFVDWCELFRRNMNECFRYNIDSC